MTIDGPIREGETSSHKQASYELVPRFATRVLDVGCGAGEDVLALAERLGRAALVVGLDASLERIDEALRSARNVALNVHFAVGDARSLPFPECSFDVVRADGLFSETDEHARVVRELTRVVTPGGRVVVHDRAEAVLGRRSGESVGEDDLLGLMRRAGLVSLELSDSGARAPTPAAPHVVSLVGVKPAAGAEEQARGH